MARKKHDADRGCAGRGRRPSAGGRSRAAVVSRCGRFPARAADRVGARSPLSWGPSPPRAGVAKPSRFNSERLPQPRATHYRQTKTARHTALSASFAPTAAPSLAPRACFPTHHFRAPRIATTWLPLSARAPQSSRPAPWPLRPCSSTTTASRCAGAVSRRRANRRELARLNEARSTLSLFCARATQRRRSPSPSRSCRRLRPPRCVWRWRVCVCVVARAERGGGKTVRASSERARRARRVGSRAAFGRSPSAAPAQTPQCSLIRTILPWRAHLCARRRHADGAPGGVGAQALTPTTTTNKKTIHSKTGLDRK